MNCRTCEHIDFRISKKNKKPYGYCKKLDLLLITIQTNCKSYEEDKDANRI